MTLAMTVAPADPDFLDAQLAFHLTAGVDLVIVPTEDASEGVREILDGYVRGGHVVRAPAGALELANLEFTARFAAVEYAADWLIASEWNEFWWPRGAGLRDVLIAVPPRYGVVQALVREFQAHPGADPFAERMTVRSSLAEASAGTEPLLHLLRSIRRLEPGVGLHQGQPLRAWYPVEVLRYPGAGGEPPDGSEATTALGLENGSLVVDERLRDVLRVVRVGSTYRVPEATAPSPIPAPSIVDDALYAVECAAVGEVNLDRLDRQIRELEDRLARLEERFWPRLLRFASRFSPGRIRGRG